MKSDDELLTELSAAINGLTMQSESDYPFATIRWDAQTEITPQFLRASAQESEAAPVAEQSVDGFFRAAVSEPD